VERLEARVNAQITGIFANPNYDAQKEGEDGPRKRILEEINEEYQSQLREILEPRVIMRERREAQEAFERDPFFNTARQLERLAEADRRMQGS